MVPDTISLMREKGVRYPFSLGCATRKGYLTPFVPAERVPDTLSSPIRYWRQESCATFA